MSGVLVIGATGHVGRATVEALQARGETVRAFVRDPSGASLPSGVELAAGDLADTDSLAAASTGVDRAFLVFPTLSGDHFAEDVVEVLSQHVQHLVYLSAAGVPEVFDATAPGAGILGSHAYLEHLIRQSGMAWTFLRSGGMATNTLGWAPEIKATRSIQWAYPDAQRPLTHERDLGDIAAHLLTTPGHDELAHIVTGSEQLTNAEQAEAIGAALGEPVRFVPLSRSEMRGQMIEDWGWDEPTADQALDSWAATVSHPEVPTDTVERLLHRTARTYACWARDHVESFR